MVKEELKQFCVLQKTQHKLSCISKDRGHEQNNKLVKRSGGAVGLTENPTAVQKWMVAGPVQARLLTEFESQFMVEDGCEIFQQHEQELASQDRFRKHVISLYEII